jgi:hypothetical protein
MQTTTQLIKAAGTGYNASIGGRTFLMQSCDAGNVLTVTLTDAQGNRYSVSNVGAGFKATPMAGYTSVQITTTADANVQFITSDGDVDLQLSQLNAVITNTAGAPANVQVQGQGTSAGNPLYVNASGATLTATNVGINNTSANPVPVSLVSEPGAPVAVNGTVNIGNTVPVTLTGSSDATAIPVQAQPIATTPTDSAPVSVQGGPAWAQSTAYALNALVAANGNIYKCTTAGTSAATGGGPTGTGTGIADGTAVWAYQSTASVALVASSGTRKVMRVRNEGPGNLAITSAAATMFQNAALVLALGDMWNETDAPGAAWFISTDTSATANVQVIA